MPSAPRVRLPLFTGSFVFGFVRIRDHREGCFLPFFSYLQQPDVVIHQAARMRPYASCRLSDAANLRASRESASFYKGSL